MPSGDWARLQSLRHEARELWDHFASDEVVYLLQDGNVELGTDRSRHHHFEAYRRGEAWLEFFVRLTGDGIDGEYAAICEADFGSSVARKDSREADDRREDIQSLMFVDVAQLSEYPQGIPSVVRLQVVDLLSDIWTGDVTGLRVERPRFPLDENGEVGVFRWLSGEIPRLQVGTGN